MHFYKLLLPWGLRRLQALQRDLAHPCLGPGGTLPGALGTSSPRLWFCSTRTMGHSPVSWVKGGRASRLLSIHARPALGSVFHPISLRRHRCRGTGHPGQELPPRGLRELRLQTQARFCFLFCFILFFHQHSVLFWPQAARWPGCLTGCEWLWSPGAGCLTATPGRAPLSLP